MGKTWMGKASVLLAAVAVVANLCFWGSWVFNLLLGAGGVAVVLGIWAVIRRDLAAGLAGLVLGGLEVLFWCAVAVAAVTGAI
jgi:hypothetical protein